jgi:hypothetical protein
VVVPVSSLLFFTPSCWLERTLIEYGVPVVSKLKCPVFLARDLSGLS